MTSLPLSVVSVGEVCSDCPVSGRGVCLRYGESLRQAISDISIDCILPKGATLVFSGDRATALYIIKKGEIKAFRSLSDGRHQIVGFAGPGDVIGNPQGQESFDCTFEALTDCVLCKSRQNEIAKVSAQYPEFTTAFMDAIANEIRRRGDQAILLGRKSAEERMAAFLIERDDNARFYDERPDESSTITLHMSRRDIADYLGLTIETVSRVLTSFKKRRLIDIKNKTYITISDRKSLSALTDGEYARNCMTRIFL